MYDALLLLGGLITLYIIWVLISPDIAFFFIADKDKRKRWPLVLYPIAAMFIISIITSDTPEGKAKDSTEEQTEIVSNENGPTNDADSIQALLHDYLLMNDDPTELTDEVLAEYERIQKEGEEIAKIEGKTIKKGPTNKGWRMIQWTKAIMYHGDLDIAQTDLRYNAQFIKGGNKGAYNMARLNDIEKKINEAMASSYDIHFIPYYKMGAIKVIIDDNRRRGLELKQELSRQKQFPND